MEHFRFVILVSTYFLGQGNPVAAGAMLVDVGFELGILLWGPGPSLDVGFVTARSSHHLC